MTARLRIATRGSPLALAQAGEVRDRLAACDRALSAPDAVEIVVIRTSGDRIRDRPLAEAGGKGLFTKHIEEALLDGWADLAVHSMKDMPTRLPDGLVIGALLPREDPRDALVSPGGTTLAALPAGAVVGTSSIRRRAILAGRRPDLSLVDFRGNVDTRLAKLAAGEADATVLAMAGLRRLGRADGTVRPIEPSDMLPAPCQGAIGVELRADDAATAALAGALDDPPTASRIAAERALLDALDGSCRTPIAALAEISGEAITLRAMIVTPDGATTVETERRGPVSEAASLGRDAGAELRRRGGADFFDGPA